MIKMRTLLLAMLVLTVSFGCVCNKCKKDKNPVEKQEIELTTVSEQNNALAFKLYEMADKPGKNMFYSPHSISSALSMVYGGAHKNTMEQMSKALCFGLSQKEQHQGYLELQKELNRITEGGKAELNVANAVFGSESRKDLVQKDYVKLVRDFYLSDYYNLDFKDYSGTAKFINRWVMDKTRDRIKDLVNEDHIRGSNEGMVLVNAIYFKGSWLNEFDPKMTIEDQFYVSSKKRGDEFSRPVEMMSARANYRYGEAPGVQLLELPYAEKDLAMLFVLPDEIDGFAKQLNPANLNKWQESLSQREVQLYIPKFKFDITFEGLTDILKAMGMTDAFDPLKSDFSGIIPNETGRGLYVYDIIHKAFVEVSEEGTEAAAATGIVVATKMSMEPEQTITFRADKPFVYILLHKPSNTVLFMGKMNEPPKA